MSAAAMFFQYPHLQEKPRLFRSEASAFRDNLTSVPPALNNSNYSSSPKSLGPKADKASAESGYDPYLSYYSKFGELTY